MKTVKYKDKEREFEMPSETFKEVFSENLILELLKSKNRKSTLITIWQYLKTIPAIVRLFEWLGIVVTK